MDYPIDSYINEIEELHNETNKTKFLEKYKNTKDTIEIIDDFLIITDIELSNNGNLTIDEIINKLTVYNTKTNLTFTDLKNLNILIKLFEKKSNELKLDIKIY